MDAGSVEGSGPPFKHPRSTPHTGGLVLDNEGEQPTSGKYGILKCLHITQHQLNSSLCRYTVKQMLFQVWSSTGPFVLWRLKDVPKPYNSLLLSFEVANLQLLEKSAHVSP